MREIVTIGGKKRATNWMNLTQLRRAVWLRRLSAASQSRFTLLKNRHRLGWLNDRRVLNGIFWVLRSGAPWRDLPEHYGPYTTCYNRFVRWRKAEIWDQIME